ncbi:MAG: hypothetical protein EXR21_02815 [Flavobacteriaceae bacterium]|nr:hypothetical protein [Flavobacteriaceae bacterium]
MFETTTYYAGWNGTRKGKRCEAGSYKFKLWWYDADGKKTLIEGRIELLL